jgi:hypothetical protein
VTFAVLGLLAGGCGGDTNAKASSTETEQQPPSNPDQPPANSERASNSDATPSNPDRPISNASEPAGTGAGGRLGTLCQELCRSIENLGDQCSGGMAMMGDTKSLCSTGCQVPASVLPCEQEIADAFSCLIDNLRQLCAAVDDAGQPGRNPQSTSSVCEDFIKAETTCAEANGITDDGSDDGSKDNASKCNKAGGCACPTACASCTCAAGTDTADCADVCPTP